jgi:hypothetical protein
LEIIHDANHKIRQNRECQSTKRLNMFSTHHIKKRGDYILSMENGKSKNADYVKLVAQIDKYWHKLFCDPITVLTPDGGTVILQPQRTNNILERFFRDFKRGYRKKTGNNSMGKVLQTITSDTPLVKNLQNPSYMELLLNGKQTIEEVFAQIDAQEARRRMISSEQSNERVPKPMQKIIAKPEFPITLRNILLSAN